MRLFLAAFALSAIVTASTSWAQNTEPLTGGSRPSPGSARFEPNPAHEYLVAKARAETANRESLLRHYDWSGFDYAHPQVNTSYLFNAQPVRVRRFASYPGLFWDGRGYGF